MITLFFIQGVQLVFPYEYSSVGFWKTEGFSFIRLTHQDGSLFLVPSRWIITRVFEEISFASVVICGFFIARYYQRKLLSKYLLLFSCWRLWVVVDYIFFYRLTSLYWETVVCFLISLYILFKNGRLS